MKRINSVLLAIAMLLATPAFFSSCQEDAPKITFKGKASVTNDFTKVVEAINKEAQKNEEAINKLTVAIDKLSGEQATKIQLITDVLKDVNATLDTKLVAVEAAMRAQTLTLQDKLDFLRKAIENNTLQVDDLSKKLTTAIDALNGTFDKKLDAITAIIKSASATTAEKLAAIDATMAAQTVALKEKLSLLITAVDDNTIETVDLSKKLANAIDALNTTVDKKLLAVEVIIKDTSATTAEKLGIIGGFIEAQTTTLNTKLTALKTAIEALPNYTDKLEAIKTAIGALPNLTGKLEAIKTAIAALPDHTEKLEAIKTALAALPDYTDKLEAIKTAIEGLPNYTTKLQAITEAIEALPNLTEKIEAIKTAIIALPNYDGKFEAVITALNNLKTQVGNLGTGQTGMTTEITKNVEAIEKLTLAIKNVNKVEAQALKFIQLELEKIKNTWGGYVDLGLPSGLKWATRNIGSRNLEDHGLFFAWGETMPKTDYSWATYKWCAAGNQDRLTKYCIETTHGDGGVADGKSVLEPDDDAATIKLGAPWRIPTQSDFEELFANCSWSWKMVNGVGCWRGVSKINKNVIYIPTTGWYSGSTHEYPPMDRAQYWISSTLSTDSRRALTFKFEQGKSEFTNEQRDMGLAVRPVRP